MTLNRLYPRPGETSAAELAGQLDLGSRAPADRPYVVANMVSTLDGRAALEGNTRGLGGEHDRELFHHLRAAGDASLVGGGTAFPRYRDSMAPPLRLPPGVAVRQHPPVSESCRLLVQEWRC